MSDEKRRYFRIMDEIIFDWRRLDEKERQRTATQLKMNQIDYPDPDRFYLMLESDLNLAIQSLKVTHAACANAFLLINRKLNLIASNQKIGLRLNLFDKEPQTVNISACGIGFETAEKFNISEPLLIEMLLLPQKAYIQCLGSVISCEPIPHEATFKTNVDFEIIREEDKEQLIQHIVQKEMGQLQQKRKLEGKGDRDQT